MNPYLLAYLPTVIGFVGAYKQNANARYQTEYQRNLIADNERYWADYYKNTGITPRYPYRTGYYQNYGSLYSAELAELNSYLNLVNRNLYW